MSRKKKRSKVVAQGPFAGLYSRHILRAIVEALDLKDDHPLTDRTAQRFFQNSNPNSYNRGKFFLALGQILIDMDFLPDLSPDLTVEAPPSAQIYADSLQSAASFWDAFMSRIQSAGSWDVDRVTAGRCFLGLAAVDLAVRLGALSWTADFDAHLPGAPLWAQENGIGRILRKHRETTGMSRAHLAGRVEVSKTTIDNWLDGRYWPDRSYIESLARCSSVATPTGDVHWLPI